MAQVVPGSTGAEALTAESAAMSVFGPSLSDMEDGEDRETPTQAEGDQPEAPQAETEDAPEPSEEPEAESTEETEQPEEPETEEPAAETPKYDPTAKFKVKVDGEEVEVTLEELAKGYSRTADYTRKTQEVAQHRKLVEAETLAARQERAQLAQNLKVLEEAVDEITPKEPDWERLRVEHPNEFAKVWAEWQQGQKDRAELRAQREAAERKVMEDQHAARQEMIRAEQVKLAEAIPAWKDEKVRNAERATIQKYAETLGYTLEDLQSIVDHRSLVVLREAALWRASQEKKPAIIQQIEKVRTSKPGHATMTRTPPNALQRSLERLAKTGSQDDLKSVFLHTIDD